MHTFSKSFIAQCLFVAAALLRAEAVAAATTITSPSAESLYYHDHNTIAISGTATGNVTRVTWACLSGCNGSGTAAGTASWSIPRVYLEAGSNPIRVTAFASSGLSESDTINAYYTIAGTTAVSFPYALSFDEGPSSLEAKFITGRGGRVTHETADCWRGGCAKFVPSRYDNTYAALGGFQFPPGSRVVHLRYLMRFGPDYVTNLDARHKHILIHRGSDVSGDRGMVYVWRTLDMTDLGIGACDNTVCRYEEGGNRPTGRESFLIGDHLGEWVSFEVAFSTLTHTVRVYVTTRDGTLQNHLLAEQSIHSLDAARDYWTRISVLGAFIDRGTTPSPDMYFMIDEVAMSDTPIGPPEGFVGGTPN